MILVETVLVACDSSDNSTKCQKTRITALAPLHSALEADQGCAAWHTTDPSTVRVLDPFDPRYDALSAAQLIRISSTYDGVGETDERGLQQSSYGALQASLLAIDTLVITTSACTISPLLRWADLDGRGGGGGGGGGGKLLVCFCRHTWRNKFAKQPLMCVCTNCPRTRAAGQS